MSVDDLDVAEFINRMPRRMTEDEIVEQHREAWAVAGYARTHCPPEEFDAIFAELFQLSEHELERKRR